MPHLCSSLLLSMVIAGPASAVTMDWTPIGNPGNAADATGFGAVAYTYNIGTFEVTNTQYVEFLNVKAASDPLGLYNPAMASHPTFTTITRSGSDGSYTYTAAANYANWPVNFVTFFDALRFANWMSNGQGEGDTETGSYTLLGNNENPNNGATVTRNPSATIVLTSQNEWYKAAYYAPSSGTYFDYPGGSDNPMICASPIGAPNRANCNGAAGGYLTNRGSYPGSPSPYGTFDQGGNAAEWNESIAPSSGISRGVRGGAYGSGQNDLVATSFGYHPMTADTNYLGFRLAMIPEPSTGLLVTAGLLGLAGWRRMRA